MIDMNPNHVKSNLQNMIRMQQIGDFIDKVIRPACEDILDKTLEKSVEYVTPRNLSIEDGHNFCVLISMFLANLRTTKYECPNFIDKERWQSLHDQLSQLTDELCLYFMHKEDKKT